MKSPKLSPQTIACLLGAVNGLIVGIVAEIARLRYEKYQSELYLEESIRRFGRAGYVLQPIPDAFIPIACIVIFAGTSHLVSRYFIDRPLLLLRFWMALGGVAILAGFHVELLNFRLSSLAYLVSFIGISYFTHLRWTKNPRSLPLLWSVIGVSAVIVTATVVQLTGLFTVQAEEMGSLLTWLICLVLVTIINFIFGTLVRLLFPRASGERLIRVME
jgi:hypothetical protein